MASRPYGWITHAGERLGNCWGIVSNRRHQQWHVRESPRVPREVPVEWQSHVHTLRAAQPPSGRSVQRRPRGRSLPQQARSRASGPASPRASSPPQVAPKRPAEQAVQGGEASSAAGAGPDRRVLSARAVAHGSRCRFAVEETSGSLEDIHAVVDSQADFLQGGQECLFDLVVVPLAR